MPIKMTRTPESTTDMDLPMFVDIIKIRDTPDSTISVVKVDDEFVCFCLEDGPREIKVKHETRIAGGTYNLKRRTWGKFYERYKRRYGHQFVWEVDKVPGFSDILIHTGNSVDHTSGCLILGCMIGMSGDRFTVHDSAKAYRKFYDMTKDQSHIILNIHRHGEL